MSINPDQLNVKINLVGIGCTIFKGSVDEGLFSRMNAVSKIIGLPVEVAIFEDSFFTLLKNRNLTCLYDLKKEFCIDGMIIGFDFKIEIWVNEKLNRIIKQFDFMNPYCLFPPYNHQISDSKFIPKICNQISVIESYTGVIKSYRIITNFFDLDRLFFNLARVDISIGNNQSLITGVTYDEKSIKEENKINKIITRLSILERS